jgi:hypothetical protein
MRKTALFVFNGDPMCFIHVLLNGLDMKTRDYEVRIIIEGAATALLPKLEKKENPLNGLWQKVKQSDLIEGACKACAKKMGTAELAKELGLSLLDGMNGHPGMAYYRDNGYEIITF